MGKYNRFLTLESLADEYGNDMCLYGKSMYWNSPKSYTDTTEDLNQCPVFFKCKRK